MKKTLTIELDDEMSAFLHADAEQIGMTVSEYLGELVKKCMEEAAEYEKARQEYLALPPFPPFEFVDGRPPKREELYDRPYLR